MSVEENNVLKKSKMVKSSIVLFVGGIIVAIIGIASLITNVMVYKSTIASYVAQEASGATVAQVTAASKQLISSQLLPAIFNSIGVYFGIALILIGAGIINDKISKGIKLVSNNNSGTEVEKVAEVAGDSEIPEKTI